MDIKQQILQFNINDDWHWKRKEIKEFIIKLGKIRSSLDNNALIKYDALFNELDKLLNKENPKAGDEKSAKQALDEFKKMYIDQKVANGAISHEGIDGKVFFSKTKKVIGSIVLGVVALATFGRYSPAHADMSSNVQSGEKKEFTVIGNRAMENNNPKDTSISIGGYIQDPKGNLYFNPLHDEQQPSSRAPPDGEDYMKILKHETNFNKIFNLTQEAISKINRGLINDKYLEDFRQLNYISKKRLGLK